MIDEADKQVDLNQILPFEDETVGEVYSAHCFEHVQNVTQLFREVARVCVVGADVTLRVPHYGQEMAMCPGHLHVISEQMVEHFSEFPDAWWTGKRRLVLVNKAYGPTKYFREAKTLFPAFTDEQIYRYVPNTCHDVAFHFTVKPR